MAGNCTGGALNCSTADWPLDEFFNGSGECKNEYCESDEDYIVRIENHIFPPVYAWFLIGLHGLVFLVGLIGNFLVCLAVYRNHTMRTVTNMFIVNLAIADFLVIFLCLPPTVVWDITETWFMGNTLCKIIPYFQTVSVSVSVLTLTFISVDRWYAICHPLKFRSTIGRAKTAIAAIWIISLLIDIPELVVLETRPRPDLPVNTIYFTQCQPSWDDEMDLYSQLVKFALLYALPLLFISVTYYQIVRVLWRSARMVVLNHPPTNNRSNSAGASAPSGDDPTTTAGSGNASRNHDNNSTSGRLVPHHSSSGGGSNAGKDLLTVNSNASIEMQLRSRRKAAKMLVVVVIVFAVCYFPVHLVSILRYAVKLPQNGFTKTAALISHWLCYFNSAINPVIYNFMSGKFRKEFRRTIACRCRWLSGYFPSLSSSSGADSQMSNYALTVAGGPGFRSTGGNNPHHHHHNRPPSTMTTAFGTTALISAAPTSAAVAGLSVITSSAAVYPLRQCRSQYRPVAASNRSGANSVLSTRCTISNTQFGSTAPS